jgi:hypothetical protein
MLRRCHTTRPQPHLMKHILTSKVIILFATGDVAYPQARALTFSM